MAFEASVVLLVTSAVLSAPASVLASSDGKFQPKLMDPNQQLLSGEALSEHVDHVKYSAIQALGSGFHKEVNDTTSPNFGVDVDEVDKKPLIRKANIAKTLSEATLQHLQLYTERDYTKLDINICFDGTIETTRSVSKELSDLANRFTAFVECRLSDKCYRRENETRTNISKSCALLSESFKEEWTTAHGYFARILPFADSLIEGCVLSLKGDSKKPTIANVLYHIGLALSYQSIASEFVAKPICKAFYGKTDWERNDDAWRNTITRNLFRNAKVSTTTTTTTTGPTTVPRIRDSEQHSIQPIACNEREDTVALKLDDIPTKESVLEIMNITSAYVISNKLTMKDAAAFVLGDLCKYFDRFKWRVIVSSEDYAPLPVNGYTPYNSYHECNGGQQNALHQDFVSHSWTMKTNGRTNSLAVHVSWFFASDKAPTCNLAISGAALPLVYDLERTDTTSQQRCVALNKWLSTSCGFVKQLMWAGLLIERNTEQSAMAMSHGLGIVSGLNILRRWSNVQGRIAVFAYFALPKNNDGRSQYALVAKEQPTVYAPSVSEPLWIRSLIRDMSGWDQFYVATLDVIAAASLLASQLNAELSTLTVTNELKSTLNELGQAFQQEDFSFAFTIGDLSDFEEKTANARVKAVAKQTNEAIARILAKFARPRQILEHSFNNTSRVVNETERTAPAGSWEAAAIPKIKMRKIEEAYLGFHLYVTTIRVQSQAVAETDKRPQLLESIKFAAYSMLLLKSATAGLRKPGGPGESMLGTSINELLQCSAMAANVSSAIVDPNQTAKCTAEVRARLQQNVEMLASNLTDEHSDHANSVYNAELHEYAKTLVFRVRLSNLPQAIAPPETTTSTTTTVTTTTMTLPAFIGYHANETFLVTAAKWLDELALRATALESTMRPIDLSFGLLNGPLLAHNLYYLVRATKDMKIPALKLSSKEPMTFFDAVNLVLDDVIEAVKNLGSAETEDRCYKHSPHARTRLDRLMEALQHSQSHVEPSTVQDDLEFLLGHFRNCAQSARQSRDGFKEPHALLNETYEALLLKKEDRIQFPARPVLHSDDFTAELKEANRTFHAMYASCAHLRNMLEEPWKIIAAECVHSIGYLFYYVAPWWKRGVKLADTSHFGQIVGEDYLSMVTRALAIFRSQESPSVAGLNATMRKLESAFLFENLRTIAGSHVLDTLAEDNRAMLRHVGSLGDAEVNRFTSEVEAYLKNAGSYVYSTTNEKRGHPYRYAHCRGRLAVTPEALQLSAARHANLAEELLAWTKGSTKQLDNAQSAVVKEDSRIGYEQFSLSEQERAEAALNARANAVFGAAEALLEFESFADGLKPLLIRLFEVARTSLSVDFDRLGQATAEKARSPNEATAAIVEALTCSVLVSVRQTKMMLEMHKLVEDMLTHQLQGPEGSDGPLLKLLQKAKDHSSSKANSHKEYSSVLSDILSPQRAIFAESAIAGHAAVTNEIERMMKLFLAGTTAASSAPTQLPATTAATATVSATMTSSSFTASTAPLESSTKSTTKAAPSPAPTTTGDSGTAQAIITPPATDTTGIKR